jgi:ferrous iron transport protein B
MTKAHTPDVILALAGNPNTGKSSIFNALTGAKQHVGNWPGKTVERVVGRFEHRGAAFEIVDLPGAYSLNASSPEEIIARDYLVGGEPDGVIVVADAANLERNLYLVIQVLEIGLPTVVVLNMVDIARSRGLTIDPEILSARLSVPVVAAVARSGKGLDALRDAIAAGFALEGSR